MIVNSLRARLTLWSVVVYGLILLLISVGSYAFVAITLREHVDVHLGAFSDAAEIALSRETAEGETLQEAAVSTVDDLNLPPGLSIAIFNHDGTLLAARGATGPDVLAPLPADGRERADGGSSSVMRVGTAQREDGRRLVVREAAIDGRRYVVVVSENTSSVREDLEVMRHVLYASVPAGLVMSALAAWFLVRKSLGPLEIMSAQAQRIGAQNLEERLLAPNPRDELGALASSFNDLLERLSAAFHQQRRFMADASHELRTPLSVISSAAEIMLQRPLRPETDYREALRIVGDETWRLRQIVDDMFMLARADAGHQAVHHAAVYLDEIIAEAVRAARVLAAQKAVDVQLNPALEAPYSGDEGLLRRMVLNLLDNAIRYTPPHTHVQVALEREAADYVVTVRDQGPGVPVEAQPHVFERFYQVEQARFHDHDGSGAGLGLAIAHWIAQAHGGSLVLQHSNETGSTFVVRLPSAKHVAG